MTENEYRKIPEAVRVSMFLYVEERRPIGSFLTAVLSNNLKDAVAQGYGDPAFDAVAQIVRWFHNYASSYCWGNREKVDVWLDGKDYPRCGDLDRGISLLELPEAVTRGA